MHNSLRILYLEDDLQDRELVCIFRDITKERSLEAQFLQSQYPDIPSTPSFTTAC